MEDFFELIFGKIDVLAVIAFVLSTLGITYFLKKIIVKNPKLCYYLDDDLPKVILSWIVGSFIFLVMHLAFTDFPVTQQTIVQYVCWILLLNGGYKIITKVRDFILAWKNKK